MVSKTEGAPENSCKNCSHPISLHKPDCLSKSEDNNETICGCKKPQYYNAIVSENIGWIEVHCNSCGKMLAFIDCTVDDIYDFNILCSKCIAKVT